VSVVAPFRYTRIIFALILGAAVFGERPDNLTLFGIVIIVASGLFTLLRSKETNVKI
jgi:drug/metabolite transporter (DMT)-like permease